MPTHHHYQFRLNDSLPIDTAFLDSIGTDAYAEAHASTPEPTIADDIAGILTCSFIIIAPFLLIAAIARIRRGLRMRRDPAFRAKQLEDMAYVRRMQSERRRLRKEEKEEERARKERARRNMSPEERQLRNIYWLLFWQGLSGRRRKK